MWVYSSLSLSTFSPARWKHRKTYAVSHAWILTLGHLFSAPATENSLEIKPSRCLPQVPGSI